METRQESKGVVSLLTDVPACEKEARRREHVKNWEELIDECGIRPLEIQGGVPVFNADQVRTIL